MPGLRPRREPAFRRWNPSPGAWPAAVRLTRAAAAAAFASLMAPTNATRRRLGLHR